MSIHAQVHDKFEVFTASSMEAVNNHVKKLTDGKAIAAKSLGIEFLEESNTYVVCLGYVEGDGYSSSVHHHKVGTLGTTPDALQTLSKGIAHAAAMTESVICHDIFVTKGGEVEVAFLTHNG